MRLPVALLLTLTTLAGLSAGESSQGDAAIGLFEKHGDIGAVGRKGGVEYEAAGRSYIVAGGGANMWSAEDAFHFAWKRASGDVSLAADVHWIGSGGKPHRKAGLLIRQSLEPDSAYADVVLHGDGLTSLQYREVGGGPTREIQSNIAGPRRIRVEKEGDYVFMSIAREGETLCPAGGSFRLKFNDPFYVGLGVCAHDNNAVEQAEFSNVEISIAQVTFDEYNDWFPHPSPDGKWIVFLSYEKGVKGHPADKDVMLRIMPADGGESRVLARLFGGQGTINVPSWSPDSGNVAFVSYRLVRP